MPQFQVCVLIFQTWQAKRGEHSDLPYLSNALELLTFSITHLANYLVSSTWLTLLGETSSEKLNQFPIEHMMPAHQNVSDDESVCSAQRFLLRSWIHNKTEQT